MSSKVSLVVDHDPEGSGIRNNRSSNVDTSASRIVLHTHTNDDMTPDVGVISNSGKLHIEAIEQWKLGVPIMISYMFQTLLPFITYLFVGHHTTPQGPTPPFSASMLSEYAASRGMNLTATQLSAAQANWDYQFAFSDSPSTLAAIGLATMSANISGWSVIVGLSGALRTFCSQCYGAGQKKMVGVYLQRGLLVTTCACIPLAVLFQFAGAILAGVGVDKHVANEAGEYLRILCANLLPYAWFQCIQKYLQTQGKVTPITVAAGCVVLLSIPVNYFFVGQYGIRAGPFMTIFAFTMMDVILIGYILKSGVHRETWGGWTWEATKKIPEFLKLAIPGVLMTCTEWWGFEVVTLMAGRIKTAQGLPDPTALATQGLLFQSNNFLFTLPLGLSVATAVRVGNFLGMNYPRRARRSTLVAFLMVTAIMCILAIIQISARDYWGRLFTSNQQVISRVSEVIVVSCLFEVLDGCVSVGSGVLRGTGKQRFGAIVNGIAYWLVGVPLGYLLCFTAGYGLIGLWFGMSAALFVQTVVLIVRFYFLKWQEECNKAQERAQQGGKKKSQPSIEVHEVEPDRYTVIFDNEPRTSRKNKSGGIMGQSLLENDELDVSSSAYVPLEEVQNKQNSVN